MEKIPTWGTEVVQQGVLSISKDENLGDTGGALVLNSGELHTTATDQMILNRQVKLRYRQQYFND